MQNQPKDDIDFIEDDIKQIKKSHTRKVEGKKIRVRGGFEVARDNYRAAKRLQKANIKQSKRDIKSYKLLKKQAKNAYKLVKLANNHHWYSWSK